MCDFVRAGLSADDRRIAVLNTAFEAFSAVFRRSEASLSLAVSQMPLCQPASACDSKSSHNILQCWYFAIPAFRTLLPASAGPAWYLR
jgi:hypothetical protein